MLAHVIYFISFQKRVDAFFCKTNEVKVNDEKTKGDWLLSDIPAKVHVCIVIPFLYIYFFAGRA